MVDTNKLNGKIAESGYSKTKLSYELGMSVNTLCDKINGKRPFNTKEIVAICHKLGIESDSEKVKIFLA